METLRQSLSAVNIYGNSLWIWAQAFAVFVLSGAALWAVRWSASNIAAREAVGKVRALRTVLAAAVQHTTWLFVIAASLFVASRFVALSEKAEGWVRVTVVIILMIQFGFWLNGLVSFFLHRYEARHAEATGRITTLRALAIITRIFIFSLVFILILDLIPGVEVSALIASLGIGGIAVALALQNILSDLFASLSISLDKPFAIGDFIMVDNFLGVVEKIGLKTTRIKSLSGEQLIFSNGDLLKSRVRNFKRMEQRRVPFTVGVTYQTPLEKLKIIPGIFKEVLDRQENVHFDRAHFKGFGAYSQDFEFVYYVHTPDYNIYMDTQQAINLGLKERFEEEGIEFAYPTQTLFIERDGDESGKTIPHASGG